MDEQEGTVLSLQDYWNVLVRRRWWLILPLFVVSAGVFYVSFQLPELFESEALILVERQKVATRFVTPNTSQDQQSYLLSITQQILSRTRLGQVIEELDLYPDSPQPPEMHADSLRKRIEIESVETRGPRQELTAFKVKFSAHDPHIAQQVCERLTDLFVVENRRVRQQRSAATIEFLDVQLEKSRKDLEEHEERIRRFKLSHIGELPDQLRSTLSLLSGLQVKLQGNFEAIQRSRQQLVYLETLQAQYEAMGAAMQGEGGAAAPLSMVEAEIKRLRKELVALEGKYTDRHPDVVKLRGQVAADEDLKKKIEENLLAEAEKPEADQPASDAGSTFDLPTRGVPPTTRARLHSDLEINRMEYDFLLAAQRKINAQIKDLEEQIKVTPIREQQLAELMRGYANTSSHYSSLVDKSLQSELADNLEILKQSEQFRVLDPASFPVNPSEPNRIRINLLGLAGGLGLGFGLVLLIEVRDTSLRTESDVISCTNLPVLVCVPDLLTAREELRLRLRRVLEWAGGVLIMASVVAGGLVLYWRS